MEQPKKDRRIVRIKEELEAFGEGVYTLGLRARTAKHVGDKEREELCLKEIEKQMKAIDYLTAELTSATNEPDEQP